MRFESLGLRIRMLLLFATLALGGLSCIVVGFAIAYRRMGTLVDIAPLLQGGIVASFGLIGFTVWMWYLFDTNVARPVESIAAAVRARAHAGVSGALPAGQGRYLGDLAGAVSAAAAEMEQGRNAFAESLARETTRISVDKQRLEHLIADVPPAVLLCTGRHRLVFYNSVARRYLGETGRAVCLGHNLFDYLNDGTVRDAHRRLTGQDVAENAVVEFLCTAVNGKRRLAGRMRLVADKRQEGAYVLTLRDVTDEVSAFATRERLLEQVFHEEWPQLKLLLEAVEALTVEGLPEGVFAAARERLSHLAAAFDTCINAPGHAFNMRMTDIDAPLSNITEPLHSVVYDFSLLERALPEKIEKAKLDELTYVVFDTETTGLNPESGDEIVQIAALRIVNGKILHEETFDMLVNPGRSIPTSASRIHGIANEMVFGAPSPDEAIKRFHHFVKGAVIVAHNAPFDMEFLYRREQQTGLRFDNLVLDTVLLSAIVFGQWEDHSLDALLIRLDIDLPHDLRHTAKGDASATAEAFLKMQDLLAAKGLVMVEALLKEARRHKRLIRDLNKER
ncbi:DNA polymerase III subunit epsilon [Agrobacterium tumefaciens]|nr:DNA polymerase III subunit epsilon [Agrobacterium tumefaciens]